MFIQKSFSWSYGKYFITYGENCVCIKWLLAVRRNSRLGLRSPYEGQWRLVTSSVDIYMRVRGGFKIFVADTCIMQPEYDTRILMEQLDHCGTHSPRLMMEKAFPHDYTPLVRKLTLSSYLIQVQRVESYSVKLKDIHTHITRVYICVFIMHEYEMCVCLIMKRGGWNLFRNQMHSCREGAKKGRSFSRRVFRRFSPPLDGRPVGSGPVEIFIFCENLNNGLCFECQIGSIKMLLSTMTATVLWAPSISHKILYFIRLKCK